MSAPPTPPEADPSLIAVPWNVYPGLAFAPTLHGHIYEARLRQVMSSARREAHAARRELTALVGADAVARAAASGNAEDLGVAAGPPGSHGATVFRAVERGSSMHHTHALYDRELRDFLAADTRIGQQIQDFTDRRIQALTRGPHPPDMTVDARLDQITNQLNEEVNRLRSGRHEAYIRSRRHAPSGTYPWHAAWAHHTGDEQGRRIRHYLQPARDQE